MYRVFRYHLNSEYNPKYKDYWNKRLRDWSYDNPSLMNFTEAYFIVVDMYLDGFHENEAEDSEGRAVNDYYYFGLEEV